MTTTMRMNDPRGPERRITAVERRTDTVLLTLDCGHVRGANQIFAYRVGEDYRCLTCGDELREEAAR